MVSNCKFDDNDIDIVELDCSLGLFNCLYNARLYKVSQINALSDNELFRIRNFGKKYFDELNKLLPSRRKIANNNDNPEDVNILCLDFSGRTISALHKAGIKKVSELMKLTDDELLRIHRFSFRSLKEIYRLFPERQGMPEITDEMDIDNLNCSYGLYSCLYDVGITTIGEIKALTDEELLNIKGLGKQKLKQIHQLFPERVSQ